MVTKLNKDSLLVRLCQGGGTCIGCDAKNDFDCVARLMDTYHNYCSEVLDRTRRKEVRFETNKIFVSSNRHE